MTATLLLMTRPLPALAAALVLSACSSDSPAESTTETPTVTVAEVCQTVADELPTGGYPDPAEWQDFLTTLDDLGEPDEITEPVDDLRTAAQALADDPTSTDLLDARSDLRAALDTLDTECVTAGSDALS